MSTAQGTKNAQFELRGTNHLALVCSDMARTIDFYSNVLGMPLVGNRKVWLESVPPVIRNAPSKPASATEAVPWMSSLKQQTLSRYRVSISGFEGILLIRTARRIRDPK
jgi:hypothetical protein